MYLFIFSQVSGGTYRITHVVVPKQTGAADSCDTHNEEEVFAFQDANNLITLGWIHVIIFISRIKVVIFQSKVLEVYITHNNSIRLRRLQICFSSNINIYKSLS